MGSTKSLVFVITSLMFLVSGAVYSQLSAPLVFAVGPAYCFEHDCPERFCDNNPAKGTATCCWRDPGIIPAQNTCQTCHVNTNTGEFENCTSVLNKGTPDRSVIAPPPSGVAPPPSTEACPENTARDAKGNCAPLTQTPKAPVPKSGPGNLLPEGVFGGPDTSSTHEGPIGLAPGVDCTQTPNDPLCETATLPEGEQQQPQVEEEPQPEEDQSSDENNNN